MKAKLIILTAVVAALLYSCSSDRDENITPVTEKTRPENLKLNPIIQNSEAEEVTVKTDTIRALDSAGGNEFPNNDEIVPPGDVKPPKGGK